MELDELKQRLADSAEEVCQHLLPGGKRIADEWCAGSLDGDPGQSMKVNCNGKAGVWKDFATGDGGDNFLELWRRVRGSDLPEAIREAKAFLGIVDPEIIRKSMQRAKPAKEFAKATPAKTDKKLVEGGPAWKYLTDERKIDPDVLAEFQVAEGQVFDDGANHPAYVFPFKAVDGTLEHVKRFGVTRRPNGKKRLSASTGTRLGLFGKNVAGASGPELLITEGEIDAMTWHQLGATAVSVPNGADAHTWLENDFDYLDGFKSILIAFDSDEAGRKGAAELARRIGIERVSLVELENHKDANEALQAGDIKALQRAHANPRALHPAELVNAADYMDEVQELLAGAEAAGISVFFTTKWRIRPHEFTIWTGYSGHGKTVLLSQIIGDLIVAGERALIASFEQPIKMTLADIVRQRTRQANPSITAQRSLVGIFSDRLWFYDHVGTKSWREVLATFAYAYKRFGVTQFVIDSLLKCDVGEEDYQGQKVICGSIADFVNQYPVHVHLVAHARKKDDYEGKAPGKHDVRGAAAITDQCMNGLTVWRNKGKEQKLREMPPRFARDQGDEAEVQNEPDATVTFWKQRATGEEPFSAMMFDPGPKLFRNKL